MNRSYDAGARFYAPYLGMFTQLDSVTGKPADPRSMNRFLYAEGNPWSMVDPSGHASFYEAGGCGPGGKYCGSHGNDQNAHTNALIVANNGTPNPGPSYVGPTWKPLATPTTETDRAADNPSFSFNLADRGQDNASLRSSPTCRWAGRAGCVPIGSGSSDRSGLIIVAGVVIGALVCVAGVCEAIALAATGAAAAEGVIATASAAASGACMVLCDKLQAIGNGFMGAYGGSGPPEAALVSYSEQAATRAAETQAQLGASSGFVTMAAGVGARADGSIVTLVASSEARATLRLGVTLNTGDILVRGSGHAEQQNSPSCKFNGTLKSRGSGRAADLPNLRLGNQ